LIKNKFIKDLCQIKSYLVSLHQHQQQILEQILLQQMEQQ